MPQVERVMVTTPLTPSFETRGDMAVRDFLNGIRRVWRRSVYGKSIEIGRPEDDVVTRPRKYRGTMRAVARRFCEMRVG